MERPSLAAGRIHQSGDSAEHAADSEERRVVGWKHRQHQMRLRWANLAGCGPSHWKACEGRLAKRNACFRWMHSKVHQTFEEAGLASKQEDVPGVRGSEAKTTGEHERREPDKILRNSLS